MTDEIRFMVGGEAGQGVQTIGFLLAKALARYGYHIFADQDYESRVRGGHNFFRVRASLAPVFTIAPQVDILIAFNQESVTLHRSELAPAGLVVYDASVVKGLEEAPLPGFPAQDISREVTGDTQAANTALLAAALALAGYDRAMLEEILRDYFGGESGEKNARTAAAVYAYIEKQSQPKPPVQVSNLGKMNRMLVTGNEAMTLGAIAAGCKFMAAYPMTPVTPIMEMMAARAQDFGLVVVPAEDEIAAINMVVGAGYAGVRAMTATSGGGFCLMVEGLGMAGITETPIVVIEGQRPGPAIGLPTRQEQGDLEFVLHASHGEFPRVVLAPATIEECFWAVQKAFNLAEKYQLPVIVMTDHHLATSYSAVPRFDLTRVTIDRGLLFNGIDEKYQRHAFTDNGISPRAFPGKSGALVVTDSDEHDEYGHLTEDPLIRSRMMNKRLGKLAFVSEEIKPPKLHGPESPETIILGWGSSYGAIREAVDYLNNHGASVAHLHLSEIWPFPAADVKDILADCGNVLVAEGNATGQLARLVQRETCVAVNGNILRYDGRPLTPEDIVTAVNREVK